MTIGIVKLSDGREFAIASYPAGSTAPEADREALHASVAAVVAASERSAP